VTATYDSTSLGKYSTFYDVSTVVMKLETFARIQEFKVFISKNDPEPHLCKN
jgi:hypothetical protein